MKNSIIRTSMLLVGVSITASGCALDLLNRWDGPVVRSQVVQAPADDLWHQLTGELPQAGLLVAGVSEADRTIDFSWVTAPGDGRQYLDCGTEAVGSASLRPRVALISLETGTRIEISSLTRATAAAECKSTGRFEEWLLTRIGMPPATPLAVTTPALGK